MTEPNPEIEVEQRATRIVQAQLDAYNARDLEAFLACYAPNVPLFNFPAGESRWKDQSPRELYDEFFRANPRLHSALLNRIVKGNIVVDHELVSGVGEREPFTAIAIYEVGERLIEKVWFVL